ncbi:MAG: hypothetical protein AAF916_09310 [Planctomycetota bacterium]
MFECRFRSHAAFLLALGGFSIPLAETGGAYAESVVIASQDFEGNTLSRGIPADRIAIALEWYDPVTGIYDIPGLGFDSDVGLGWTFDTDATPPVGTAPDALSDNGDVIGVVFDDTKDFGTTNGLFGAPGQTGNFYLVEDADSTWTVTFDTFDTAGFSDLELSFTWGIDNDGGGVPAGAGSNFEDDDFIEVTVNGTSVFRVDGTGDFSAGDATGGLDDLDAPYINAFAPETVDLSAFDGQILEVAFIIANNTAPEDIAFDNVAISGIEGVLGIPGDYDDDGQVAQGDLNLVLNNWGQTAPFLPNSDPFASAIVDQEELNRVLNNWGSTSAPSFERFTVPEPGVLAGAAVAATGLLTRRRRA